MTRESLRKLELPESVVGILSELDQSATDLIEYEVGSRISTESEMIPDLITSQRRACFAEIAALEMRLLPHRKTTDWGSRFGPACGGTLEDGSKHYFPDVTKFDQEILDYWMQRAIDSKHSVFKARYADMLWDMTKVVTKSKPPFRMAQRSIEAYIDCAVRFPESREAEKRIERALEIALCIKDRTRVESVVAAMFQLLEKTAFPDSRLLWLMDVPNQMKGVIFSSDQEARLVSAIEIQLEALRESENPVGILARQPAILLADYYARRGQLEDRNRVLRSYGEAIERFASTADGLNAMTQLQDVYRVFLDYGLKDEAARFQIAGKTAGIKGRSQMTPQVHIVEWSSEELDNFALQITADGLRASLQRIGGYLFPTLNVIEQSLEEMSKSAGLLSMLSITEVDEGQVVAVTGPVASDQEGRMMFTMKEYIKYSAIPLKQAFDRTREVYSFTSESLLPILFESPLFEPCRHELFKAAIDAYCQNDFVDSVHVFVPQIENCLRRLLGLLGRPTNKHRRSNCGVMIEKSLNDILEEEPLVVEALGKDAVFYLRVLLCDPRGFNVRNRLAHGLMLPEHFNRGLNDRLFQAVLLLAQVKQKTVSGQSADGTA